MTQRYITRNIRTLLTEGFSDEELRRLCLDAPDFRPVHNQLSREMGKDLIIDRLIEYTYQNFLLDRLLRLLRDLNPACYGQHHPYEGELDLAWPEVAAYLAAVAETCGSLPLEGSDQRISLTNVFVMLQAVQIRSRQGEVGLSKDMGEKGDEKAREKNEDGEKGDEKAGEKNEDGEKGDEKAGEKNEDEIRSEPPSPPVEVSKVLREHPRLVIWGEPGSGKTTLLRYIALCLATNQAEAKLKLTDQYLPVFLGLHRLSPGATLEQLLLRELTAAPYHLPPQTIQDWLNDGRLLLLLDALDEVTLEQRANIWEQVDSFVTSQKWGHNRLVLTSRIAAYHKGNGLSSARFAHYTLCPLTGAEDAKLYVLGWLRSLGIDETKAEIKTEAKANHLIEYMTKQSGLRRVMSNPLQLRLAVAVYYEGGLAALTNRAQLYCDYLEEVLPDREEREKALASTWDWDHQVIPGLERIAWARHTHPKGQLTGKEARNVIGANGRKLLKYFRERTGLIVEIGQTERNEPLLAFSHQTYQEYLVARVLSRAWQKGKKQREAIWRILKPRLHHPDWREPILLLAELLPPAEAGGLLRRIHHVRSPYEQVLHRDLLLALACLADGVKVDELISGKLINEAIMLCRATYV